MFSEQALYATASEAVLSRARTVMRYGYIMQRNCTYVEKYTVLDARVESSSGTYYSRNNPDSYYQTGLVIDESANKVVRYACTCPASMSYPGPCKHAVALGLDFIDRPEGFNGYDISKHVVTTRSLASLLDRSTPIQALPLNQPTDAPGEVYLEPTLIYSEDTGDFFLRLRIVGAQGGYVIKNIASFVDSLLMSSVVTFGKKLSVQLVESSFDEKSWELIQWLAKGVSNRRAFAAERYYGNHYYLSSTSGTGAHAGREMRLSQPEIDEFIEMFFNKTILFSHKDAQSTTRPRTQAKRANKGSKNHPAVWELFIEDGDPMLAMELIPGQEESFELICKSDIATLFSTGRYLYCIQKDRLLRCSNKLELIQDFLLNVVSIEQSKIFISADDAPRFAAYVLPNLMQATDISVPTELSLMLPVPAALSFYFDRVGQNVRAEVFAQYGEERYQIRPTTLAGQIDAKRDVLAESQVRQLVSQYFMQVRDGNMAEGVRWEIPTRDYDAVARLVFGGLAKMRELGEVYTTQAFDRLVSSARPRVHMGLSVSSNLLQLSVSADDIPLDELYSLLRSYRQKKAYHRMRDGSLLDLSGIELHKAARLAEELGLSAKQLAAGSIEMPLYKAFLLENMVSDEEKDESFYQWLEDFRSIDPDGYESPAAIARVLRPYQRQGFQWLCALADMGFGGILADEMGLGKTIQLIAFLLAHRGRGRSLVVCPASLVYNWQAEFSRFAPALDVAVVAGTAAQRRAVRAEAGHEVLITSYDLLRRDIHEYAAESFYCAVLDEAQFIKNHQTLAAQAVKTLVAHHRFALTGTPIENRLSELWSIFDFLMPGLLGGYERFRDRFESPIVSGDDETAAQLRAAVAPFILRRLKRDVLTDLPDKLEMPIVARMEGEQLKLYQAHEQALRLSLSTQGDAELARGKLQVLAELTRLRQLCCDPRLLYEDYKGGSCKLDTIWDLVSATVDAGAKAIVFSQFTSFLALIAERLRKEHVAFYELTGATPKKRRLELANAFNSDDTPVFLISLKAGGTGLNLTGAQVVIHADPWWNLAAEDQATDRAHRIGQENVVSVYKVLCKNTIEERIVALQALKSDLADAVVGEGGGLSLGSLSREDLLNLLG